MWSILFSCSYVIIWQLRLEKGAKYEPMIELYHEKYKYKYKSPFEQKMLILLNFCSKSCLNPEKWLSCVSADKNPKIISKIGHIESLCHSNLVAALTNRYNAQKCSFFAQFRIGTTIILSKWKDTYFHRAGWKWKMKIRNLWHLSCIKSPCKIMSNDCSLFAHRWL